MTKFEEISNNLIRNFDSKPIKMDGCGFSFWHPRWLQRFAKTRWYLWVYAILGTIQSASTTYFAITLTTMEKRFRMPSQTTGNLRIHLKYSK